MPKDNLERWIRKELLWNRMMFNIIRALLLFGLGAAMLLFTILMGAIAVEGFGAPSLVGGDRRTETLFYGFIALVILTALTKNAIFWHWRHTLMQLHEAHAMHVANIHRASRCSPEYYR